MYIYLIDDFSRVTLNILESEEGSDYINASFIDVRIITTYIIISIYLYNNISTCRYIFIYTINEKVRICACIHQDNVHMYKLFWCLSMYLLYVFSSLLYM